MNEIIGKIKIETDVSIPVWAVTHTLETISSNYLKVQTIRQMCAMFQQGASDQDFRIAVSSFDLYPGVEQTGYDEQNLITLQSKADSAAMFWRLFGNLHRPWYFLGKVQNFFLSIMQNQNWRFGYRRYQQSHH
jgi:hypothetical protein